MTQPKVLFKCETLEFFDDGTIDVEGPTGWGSNYFDADQTRALYEVLHSFYTERNSDGTKQLSSNQ